MPHILLASVFLGMFQWTNYWDFVIYFVVTGGVVLIANIIRFEGKIIRILAVTIVQAVEIIGLSYLVILPFTLKFDTMVQGVALAQHHSLWYQLLILWGLPVLLTVLLILSVITEKMRGLKHKNFLQAAGGNHSSGSFCSDHGLMCYRTGFDPGACICAGYL